eukprot:Clim_evm51s251 gene=Clim_evmTU51s251
MRLSRRPGKVIVAAALLCLAVYGITRYVINTAEYAPRYTWYRFIFEDPTRSVPGKVRQYGVSPKEWDTLRKGNNVEYTVPHSEASAANIETYDADKYLRLRLPSDHAEPEWGAVDGENGDPHRIIECSSIGLPDTLGGYIHHSLVPISSEEEVKNVEDCPVRLTLVLDMSAQPHGLFHLLHRVQKIKCIKNIYIIWNNSLSYRPPHWRIAALIPSEWNPVIIELDQEYLPYIFHKLALENLEEGLLFIDHPDINISGVNTMYDAWASTDRLQVMGSKAWIVPLNQIEDEINADGSGGQGPYPAGHPELKMNDYGVFVGTGVTLFHQDLLHSITVTAFNGYFHHLEQYTDNPELLNQGKYLVATMLTWLGYQKTPDIWPDAIGHCLSDESREWENLQQTLDLIKNTLAVKVGYERVPNLPPLIPMVKASGNFVSASRRARERGLVKLEEGSAGRKHTAVEESRPHHLCIIVPFRKAQKELDQFLPYMSEWMMNKAKVPHTFLVVNQVDKYRFNRGSVLNAGVKHADKLGCDYVLLNDVDTLPKDPLLDFSYPGETVHMTPAQLYTRMTYVRYFGGVHLMSVKDFEAVNGFSNFFWGWGGEDDEFRNRFVNKRIGFMTPNIGDPDKFHGQPSWFSIHPKDRSRDVGKAKARSAKGKSNSGYRSLEYTLVKEHELESEGVKYHQIDVKIHCKTKSTPWCKP